MKHRKRGHYQGREAEYLRSRVAHGHKEELAGASATGINLSRQADSESLNLPLRPGSLSKSDKKLTHLALSLPRS